MKRLVAALLAILTVGFPVGYLVLGQKGMVSFERKEVLLLYGALLAVLVAVSLLAVLLGRGHFDSRPRPARALGGAVKLCGVLAIAVGIASVLLQFVQGYVSIGQLGYSLFGALMGVGLLGAGQFIGRGGPGGLSPAVLLVVVWTGFSLVLLIAGKAVSPYLPQRVLDFLTSCAGSFLFLQVCYTFTGEFTARRARAAISWGWRTLVLGAVAYLPNLVRQMLNGGPFELLAMLSLATHLLFLAAVLAVTLWYMGAFDRSMERVGPRHGGQRPEEEDTAAKDEHRSPEKGSYVYRPRRAGSAPRRLRR